MNKAIVLTAAMACVLLTGCQTMQSMSASSRANEMADQNRYQPIKYTYQDTSGPTLVVLPGEIKSNNATFLQKVTANNIADYAELELSKANFGVLERSDLGPLLNEITLAVNMGDPGALRRFRRGKFKSTQWFVKFDVLKVEQAAQAFSGLSGSQLGNIICSFGRNCSTPGNQIFKSIEVGEASGVWLIGMRYKLMDARTSKQVATGYFEDKMELGSSAVSMFGIHQGQSGGVTLDTMVHRLVQQAVQEIDQMKISSRGKSNGSNSRARVRKAQQALNHLGYDVGSPDGIAGPRTHRAIASFQQENGIKISGNLDSETMDLLKVKN